MSSLPAAPSTALEPGVLDALEFEYTCPDSGITARFADDCRPLALEVPSHLFARPREELATLIVDALNVGAFRCQAALDDESDDASGLGDLVPPMAPPDSDTLDASPPDLDACMERLHTVANLLTEAHHELLGARSVGSDPEGVAEAQANSAGAIVGLTLRPQYASNGPRAAAQAILSAAQEAVAAANSARARVIGHALGAVLDNSLARGRHGESAYL